jgi:cytochrome o ubiquinol oxidase subunit 2
MCLSAIALSAFYMSTSQIAVLEPKGMIGHKERELIITASLLMLIVVVPVFILTWVFAWKYREDNAKAKHAPDWEHNYIAEYCWWGVPVIIIGILAITTWKSSHELNPFKPIVANQKPLTIQVVALNWKWLFLYPEQGIATVNFVQFPENIPIEFEITSDAPMNSFWIPQLGGQIYAMPAMRSKLYLIANEVGTFRGVSANISGKGFAGMKFTAKATTEEEFEKWVKGIQQSPKHLDLVAYRQLAEPSEYNPPEYYLLVQRDLFENVLMKYTQAGSKLGGQAE